MAADACFLFAFPPSFLLSFSSSMSYPLKLYPVVPSGAANASCRYLVEPPPHEKETFVPRCVSAEVFRRSTKDPSQRILTRFPFSGNDLHVSLRGQTSSNC
ncbi:hypothetical protein F4779DRAFT_329967 [Xylariaceae sp. FL0662B]|nr:hypothetical protein F4779DRAFT_329967 [Xylariaceae sp. FL0662B]